jgi:hypothetical protein
MRRTQVHGTLTQAPALARADDLRLREELRAQHDGGRKVSWSACRALGLGRTASAQTWQSGEIARLLDAIAGVVHHACEAERHVTFFVFDDDVDQPVTDVISPTLVRASLAMGSIETKDGTLI